MQSPLNESEIEFLAEEQLIFITPNFAMEALSFMDVSRVTGIE